MPVVSVAETARLVDSGQLNGREVAVGGYLLDEIHSCYAVPDDLGPLQLSPCESRAFADTRAAAEACSPFRANQTCNVENLAIAPFLMPEIVGPVKIMGRTSHIVLLGHAGDARERQCTPISQSNCANSLVADRIVWADGKFYPFVPTPAWNDDYSRQLPARMNVDDVQAAIGGGALVNASMFQAWQVSSIDPRWNLVGHEVVWIARYLTSDADSADSTRSVDVAVVDDASGTVIASQPLPVDQSYAPARLSLAVERLDVDGSGSVINSLFPFLHIRSSDGTEIYEGPLWTMELAYSIQQGSGGPTLLVGEGDYVLAAWLATWSNGSAGEPVQACSTSLHVDALANVGKFALFSVGSSCTWITFEPPA